MPQIDVAGSGAILLGSHVSCDGFHIEHPIRIQTHWHLDHLSGFGPSKRGEIALTPLTCKLLSLTHPDLPIRGNVHQIKPGDTVEISGQRICFLRSDHCLGAVQVAVELVNGVRVGYSGDFYWPLDEVIQVDELVVDASYGSPTSDRDYTQRDAEEELIHQVRLALREGPVHLFAHSGVGERALAVLTTSDVLEEIPVLASERFCHSTRIHREAGYHLPNVINVKSSEGMTLLGGKERYVRCWGLGQQMANDVLPGTMIRLTKYRADHVVERVGDQSYVIGLSNHADFASTIEYIERTGANFVLTDGTRTSDPKARGLAAAIIRELGIEARAATPLPSMEYGK